MDLNVHEHPDGCLQQLGYRYCDGGREDYFRKLLMVEVPQDIAECAVVAISLATFFDPHSKSPALSYRDAFDSLEGANWRMKPWKNRNFRESTWDYLGRRVRELLAEKRIRGTPKHQDPRYGTDTNSISRCLGDYGFTFVFGEPLPSRKLCICRIPGTLVVDGMFEDGGDHAFTIDNGEIVADYDFRRYRDDFLVKHIWRRL